MFEVIIILVFIVMIIFYFVDVVFPLFNTTSSAEPDYEIKKPVKFEEVTFDVLYSKETSNNYERLSIEYFDWLDEDVLTEVTSVREKNYKISIKSHPGVYWAPGWSNHCNCIVLFAIHIKRKPEYRYERGHLWTTSWGIIDIRDTVHEKYYHLNGLKYVNDTSYENIDESLFGTIFNLHKLDTTRQTPTVDTFTKLDIERQLNTPVLDSDRKSTKNNNMDAISQITKLAELRDKSIITEEEFQMKKPELLDSIGKNEDK